MHGPVSQSVSEATFPPCHVISTVVICRHTTMFWAIHKSIGLTESTNHRNSPPAKFAELMQAKQQLGSQKDACICRIVLVHELCAVVLISCLSWQLHIDAPYAQTTTRAGNRSNSDPACLYVFTSTRAHVDVIPLPSKTASFFAEGHTIVSRFCGSVGSRQIEVAGAEWEKLWHR